MIPEVFGDTLLRPFLQIAGTMAAMLLALSRVSDFKHHWSDVFAGSTLGLVVAVLVAVYVSDLLRIPISRDARIEKGDVMPLYGSGSAIGDQLSSDKMLCDEDKNGRTAAHEENKRRNSGRYISC